MQTLQSRHLTTGCDKKVLEPSGIEWEDASWLQAKQQVLIVSQQPIREAEQLWHVNKLTACARLPHLQSLALVAFHHSIELWQIEASHDWIPRHWKLKSSTMLPLVWFGYDYGLWSEDPSWDDQMYRTSSCIWHNIYATHVIFCWQVHHPAILTQNCSNYLNVIWWMWNPHCGWMDGCALRSVGVNPF